MIKIKNKNYKLKNNKGIALFVAMVVSSIALIIGASVMNISLKEIKLSSVGRESAQAFYAADTGLECALYWDDILNLRGGKTIFPKDNSGTPNPTSGFSCAGSVTNILVTSTPTSAKTTFTVKFGVKDNPCSNVSVSKVDNSTYVSTTIDSLGLSSCNPTNQRRSERGLKDVYTNSY